MKYLNKNQIKFLFISAGVLWLLGLGAIYIQNNHKFNHISATSEGILGGQTYRNDKYGFEFKYPGDFEIWNDESVTGGAQKWSVALRPKTGLGNFGVMVWDRAAVPKGLIFVDSSMLKSQSSTTVNGIEALSYTYSAGLPLSQTRDIIISQDNYVYMITFDEFNPDTENMELMLSKYHQILSTFKFIPTSTLDISNWKTYRNVEYGFEFKYPESLEIYDYGSIEERLLGVSLTLKNHTAPFMEFEILDKTPSDLIASARQRLTDPQVSKNIVDEKYSIDRVEGRNIGNSGEIGFEQSIYREIVITLDNEKSLLITSVDFEESYIDRILSTFTFTK